MTDRKVLQLASGVIIDVATGQPIAPTLSAERVEQVQTRQSQETLNDVAARGRDRNNRSVRSGIIDLPADPRAINTVGIVWVYFTFGLNDAEISEATGLRIDQIDIIKGTQVFTQLNDRLVENIDKLRHGDVQQRLDSMAGKALDGLVDITNNPKVKSTTKARVLMDLLDRGGFSPKQITEHRHTLDGGLTIRHVRSDSTTLPKNIPSVQVDKTIDVE